MKKYLAGLLLGLCTMQASCGAMDDPNVSVITASEETLTERLDSASQKYLKTGRAAGYGIEVRQKGKVLYSKGFGKANLEWNKGVSADTVFRIASITKMFTASSIMQLVENNKLSLTDRLDKFYPDVPRASEITIDQLLSHTSGIPSFNRYHKDKTDFDSVRTTEEIVRYISEIEPKSFFEPGTAYNYSNSGYYLLGAIVEKISGMSLGQYMDKNIFKPLALDNTAMDKMGDIIPNRAAGYYTMEGKVGFFENAPQVPYTTPGPAGGLRSTVSDLAKWQQELFFNDFLSPSTLKVMMKPSRTKGGQLASEVFWNDRKDKYDVMSSSCGYGMFIEDVEGVLQYGHSGGINGFHSEAYSYPEFGVTIALIANTSGGLEPLLNIVRDIVLDEVSTQSGGAQ